MSTIVLPVSGSVFEIIEITPISAACDISTVGPEWLSDQWHGCGLVEETIPDSVFGVLLPSCLYNCDIFRSRPAVCDQWWLDRGRDTNQYFEILLWSEGRIVEDTTHDPSILKSFYLVTVRGRREDNEMLLTSLY